MSDPRITVEARALKTRHGVIRRSDALAAGMNQRQIARRVAKRQWIPGPARGVYVLASVEAQPLTRLAAAVEGCAAVAWGPSALALWGLRAFPRTPVVATGVQLHEARGLEIRAIAGLGGLPLVKRSGIPTASLELAVVSVAYLISERSLNDLFDRVIRDRLSTWERLEPVIANYRRQGRAGSAMLGRIAEDRSIGGAVPLSIWSRDVADLLVGAGFDGPAMEWRVCTANGQLIAQVDLAYPGSRYAIELDSVAFHLNREAFVGDRRRDAALARVGWLVRRFTWEQFRDEPELMLATIRADLAARQPLNRTG